MYHEEPQCPHCGERLEDLWDLGLGDGQTDETECGHCCKPIQVSVSLTIHYEIKPVRSVLIQGFRCTICDREQLLLETVEKQPLVDCFNLGAFRCVESDIAKCRHCGFKHHPEMGGDGVETFIPAQMPPPNESHLRMMRHALAWPRQDRNCYLASEDSFVGKLWNQLVAVGLAGTVKNTSSRHQTTTYFVTEEGIDALVDIDNETPCSEQAS